ncbi:gustatory receptor 68a-like isoform X4 [Hermetia illucens]|uniref:gustatory receptor 68a-like isoform X4 n=1 Tax=Hermetia illucens TaxID=343691 RepID=UPI0018CC78B0|nr:gustatory receptor 68a-like isoform X4 [Hermetia illucens]
MQMVYCNLNISFINRVCTITFSRLKYINNELGCRVRETGHSTKELVKLISRHSSLCEIIQHLNSCYGLVALICVAFSSYTITKDVFVISTLWELGFRIEALIRYTLWISLNLIYMTSLAASSGNIKNEAKKTAEILSRAYGKGKDYQNIIDKFLTKSIRQETKFTAYGFFVIDNSTLFKIISAVTTYLVILIQFKQLEESKND